MKNTGNSEQPNKKVIFKKSHIIPPSFGTRVYKTEVLLVNTYLTCSPTPPNLLWTSFSVLHSSSALLFSITFLLFARGDGWGRRTGMCEWASGHLRPALLTAPQNGREAAGSTWELSLLSLPTWTLPSPMLGLFLLLRAGEMTPAKETPALKVLRGTKEVMGWKWKPDLKTGEVRTAVLVQMAVSCFLGSRLSSGNDRHPWDRAPKGFPSCGLCYGWEDHKHSHASGVPPPPSRFKEQRWKLIQNPQRDCTNPRERYYLNVCICI